jgi:hypothetical protein
MNEKSRTNCCFLITNFAIKKIVKKSLTDKFLVAIFMNMKMTFIINKDRHVKS